MGKVKIELDIPHTEEEEEEMDDRTVITFKHFSIACTDGQQADEFIDTLMDFLRQQEQGEKIISSNAHWKFEGF